MTILKTQYDTTTMQTLTSLNQLILTDEVQAHLKYFLNPKTNIAMPEGFDLSFTNLDDVVNQLGDVILPQFRSFLYSYFLSTYGIITPSNLIYDKKTILSNPALIDFYFINDKMNHIQKVLKAIYKLKDNFYDYKQHQHEFLNYLSQIKVVGKDYMCTGQLIEKAPVEMAFYNNYLNLKSDSKRPNVLINFAKTTDSELITYLENVEDLFCETLYRRALKGDINSKYAFIFEGDASRGKTTWINNLINVNKVNLLKSYDTSENGKYLENCLIDVDDECVVHRSSTLDEFKSFVASKNVKIKKMNQNAYNAPKTSTLIMTYNPKSSSGYLKSDYNGEADDGLLARCIMIPCDDSEWSTYNYLELEQAPIWLQSQLQNVFNYGKYINEKNNNRACITIDKNTSFYKKNQEFVLRRISNVKSERLDYDLNLDVVISNIENIFIEKSVLRTQDNKKYLNLNSVIEQVTDSKIKPTSRKYIDLREKIKDYFIVGNFIKLNSVKGYWITLKEPTLNDTLRDLKLSENNTINSPLPMSIPKQEETQQNTPLNSFKEEPIKSQEDSVTAKNAVGEEVTIPTFQSEEDFKSLELEDEEEEEIQSINYEAIQDSFSENYVSPLSSKKDFILSIAKREYPVNDSQEDEEDYEQEEIDKAKLKLIEDKEKKQQEEINKIKEKEESILKTLEIEDDNETEFLRELNRKFAEKQAKHKIIEEETKIIEEETEIIESKPLSIVETFLVNKPEHQEDITINKEAIDYLINSIKSINSFDKQYANLKTKIVFNNDLKLNRYSHTAIEFLITECSNFNYISDREDVNKLIYKETSTYKMDDQVEEVKYSSEEEINTILSKLTKFATEDDDYIPY